MRLTVLQKGHQHHRLVDVGHPHAVDEEIFEVREGHFRCLINFTIHRITTMGEIKRIPKRNNFKNNCRYSILTLCLSLQGFVTIQTTIRNKPPKIKILTHIVLSQSFATSQVDSKNLTQGFQSVSVIGLSSWWKFSQSLPKIPPMSLSQFGNRSVSHDFKEQIK